MTGNRASRWPHLVPVLLLITVSAPPVSAEDCNSNGIEDACDLDCGDVGGPCDVPGCGTAVDCNANLVPDECDLALGASGCGFTWSLLDNSTGASETYFIGPPDDLFYGLGGQIVTYDFNCGIVVDGPGPDFTIYEIDGGTAEFGSLGDVLVSADGITFHSIKATEGTAVRIPGDEACTNMNFARSYDLGPGIPRGIRYLRTDGSGTGAAGPSTGFDLDAVGAANRIGLDCDANGTLDACETHADCNANGIADSCEMAAGLDPDCNANAVIDACDISSATSTDCDLNGVPDECEPDCNGNAVADACDIASSYSEDCDGNLVPDECDLTTVTFVVESGPLSPVATARPASFTVSAAFPASAGVTLSIEAEGDFDATNEVLDVTLNGTSIGQLLEAASTHCSTTSDALVIPADTFNLLTHGGDATFVLTATTYVSQVECLEPTIRLTLSYDAIVDCNANGTIDGCDIGTGTSTDLNLNGIADECETDCNGNAAPDDYDIAQGTSQDCNGNAVPDECDVGTGASLDCNVNVIPDECEVDCNANAMPDDCDIAAGTSLDCDLNAIPDECDMVYATDGCAFPRTVFDNSTGAGDWRFVGPPDDVFYGLGGQIVTLEFGCGFVADLPGVDITVYEVDSGAAEFNTLGDVLVSDDGVTFVSVKATETTAVNIPGDEQHGSNSFARSYDIAGTGYRVVRFVRLDGAGTGAAGASTGFDFDAVGAIHRIGRDCDGSGLLDACETLGDCDGNLLPDACEVALDPDCNVNVVLDECDISGGASTDYNLNLVPDECEPDCNENARPDDYDIAQGDSSDCNHNAIPDECDLSAGASQDCNGDTFPDECPICPLVEVSFIMDISTSMDDEAAALCSNIGQIVAELGADLIDLDTELMGIAFTGSGIYSCLTESVIGNYGSTVPGSPPPGNEVLGDCPGGVEVPSEDWGRATSVVAGNKPWIGDSVKLIVPLSDEGPWCGDPTTDPGVDRDSILHAIGIAQGGEVIVSPVTCSGSSAAMIALAQQLANSTGGQRFYSTLPANDLADGLKGIIYDACDSRNDCNRNDVPDSCDIVDGTSQDCDLNERPDECEEDCNGNGVKDSCDIDWGTSQDANLNVVPDECEVIVLTADATSLHWSAVDAAIGYDLIEGDLAALRTWGGDFAAATDGCMANDHPTLDQAHGLVPDPLPGEGVWYLVRGVLGTIDLSYDTFTDAQHHSRDAEIAASAAPCP